MSKPVYMRSSSGEVFSTSHPEYHKGCENLGSGTKGYAARQEYARKCLREFIKPGATVYCMLRSVSKSGMGRVISFYVVQNGAIRGIDTLMSDACGISQRDGGGLYFPGCGMDMGFSGVYSLGRALYPEGFGLEFTGSNGKPGRPVSKRAAAMLVKNGAAFRGRNGDASGWDNDGGYALRHSWL